MKNFLVLLSFIVVFSTKLDSQTLVSAQFVGAKTKNQLTQAFNLPLIKFGAKFYKINYKSNDAKGKPDTLSGLLAIPDVNTFAFPIAFYQHGTSDCKTCVPSRYVGLSGNEGEVGLIGAGLGFINILPDYVGMGDGRGFQTYVHAATTESASIDMLNAVKEWLLTNEVKFTDQLFLTGYSQGGYASMALHKALEEKHPDIPVTAAAHLSGPYSLSRVMRDLILEDKEYGFPGYLPNTLLGFNEVSPLFNSLNEVFKTEYATEISKYYNGTITLGVLNAKLIATLKQNNAGKAVAGQMLKDSIKQILKNDLNHPMNMALRDNDLFRWAPKAPTKIYYCTNDDQVSYLNSVMAKDTMTALGAKNLEVFDVLSSANHGACFTPALRNTILFFLSQQKLIPVSAEDIAPENSAIVYPNPSSDEVIVTNLTPNSLVEVFDISGKKVHQGLTYGSAYVIDINQYAAGHYRVKATNGGKIVSLALQKI